jgi:hypothetical protein
MDKPMHKIHIKNFSMRNVREKNLEDINADGEIILKYVNSKEMV